MTDQTAVVHIGENSPEYVALLMTERLLIVIEGGEWKKLSRTEYFNTYAECLDAVKNPWGRLAKPKQAA